MENKKSGDYQKRVIVNMSDYDYGEITALLKSENIGHAAKFIRFFLESIIAGDESARNIVESYKEKNKTAGRIKKNIIKKEEDLAKKSKAIYNLESEDIENIYDLLDETLPI